MEFVFFSVFVFGALEGLLRFAWADPYFRHGIRVYEGTTSVARQTAIELYLAEDRPLGGGPVLRRETFREVRFRWTLLELNDMDFGIHGRILELTDGRHRIIAFIDIWPHVAALALALECALTGGYVWSALAVAFSAGIVPFQRRRAERIRRIIEKAG